MSYTTSSGASLFAVTNATVGTIGWTTGAAGLPAQISLTAGASSVYLVLQSCGVSAQTNGLIDGVSFIITRSAAVGAVVRETNVQLMRNGTILSANSANTALWTAANSSCLYAGSGNLWGSTWTPTLTNDASGTGFGIAITLVNTSDGTVTAGISTAMAIIHYSVTSPLIGKETRTTLSLLGI